MPPTESCLTCQFSRANEEERRHFPLRLRCHGAAPTVDGDGHAVWPIVTPDLYCGSYRSKEDPDARQEPSS